MLDNIDYFLTQLDFDAEELACDRTRGFWYAGIAMMAATVVGLVTLNIMAFT